MDGGSLARVKSGAMRSIVVVLGLVVALASVARAQDDVSTQARTLYERGMAHFQLAEYDDAIAKWQEGFRPKPVEAPPPKRVEAPPPKPVEAPPPKPVEASTPKPAAPPVAHVEEPAPSAAAPNELTAAAPSREKPLTKKPWFWGVVAGGVVV